MRLETQLTYAQPLADVQSMLHDADFWSAVADATHSLSHSFSVVEQQDSGSTTEFRRVLPAAVPAYAQRLVGDTLEVVERVTWSGPHAEFAVTITGTPLALNGQALLAASTLGTTQSVTGDARCPIPLVGGKIERAAIDAVRAALTAQERVAQTWRTAH